MPKTTVLIDDDFVDQPRRSKQGWKIILIVFGSILILYPCLVALLLPAVQISRESSRRTQAVNKLENIGGAVHQFHEKYLHLPPVDVVAALGMPELQKQGWEVEFLCEKCQHPLVATNQKLTRRFACPHCQHVMTVPAWGPSHSWMTYLLPYLDHQSLYDSIQLGKAWSATENFEPFSRELMIFWNASEPRPYTNSEGYGLAYFAANSHVIDPAQPIRISAIIDGTSQTLFAAQVHRGLKPWGDPTNHRDPANGLDGGENAFGSPHHNTVYALMADGSVKMLAKDLAPEIFRAMGTPSDSD